ncbi:MAG: 23S rRNA (uracil-C(5))-methyltransferase RlmCD [Firmicutes bacterium ADurb.Bin182]|nr:MAG: 23S rRNA (uracil-C(5))-methyltransferase RlmCD [Firmicutes bacterium ADurb.Bin182]
MKLQPPVKKNDDIVIEITSLNSQGQGVGRYEDYAVFVPGAIPGEKVQAHIIKVNQGYGVGKLQNILTSSAERVDPLCPAYGSCGGCVLQHIRYEAQLKFKRQAVTDALERIGGFKGIGVNDTIGMSKPWSYRNKGAFPVSFVNGKIEAGFFAPRSHRIIPISDCSIQDESVILCVNAVRDWANEFGIRAYDEQTQKGTLRHVVARTSSNGEVMAVVVTMGSLPRKDELITILRERVPGLASIIHNVNSKQTSVILGEKYTVLWGKERLEEQICSLKFMVSPASFLQVNPVQTEKLYGTALEYAALTGNETVIDIYCGIGTITLLLAQKAKTVIGIEYVPEAVKDAKNNANINGITNAKFICAKAEEELPRLVSEGIRPDVAVLDPPRKGAEPELLHAIIESKTPKVVYVSCNPTTLARDLKILAEGGYEIRKVQPVDMFPHTEHVECCCLLAKIK